MSKDSTYKIADINHVKKRVDELQNRSKLNI